MIPQTDHITPGDDLALLDFALIREGEAEAATKAAEMAVEAADVWRGRALALAIVAAVGWLALAWVVFA